MERINQEHLAPYVPYKVKVTCRGEGYTHLNYYMLSQYLNKTNESYDFKLLLRPVSDLKSPEFEMEEWRKAAVIFMDETANLPYNSRKEHIGGLMYRDILQLLEWHFDIFGLIPKGLAIDINTLKK